MNHPQKAFKAAINRIIDSDLFVYCPKTHMDVMVIVNKKHETVTGFIHWLERVSLGEFKYFVMTCSTMKIGGMNSFQWVDYCERYKKQEVEA